MVNLEHHHRRIRRKAAAVHWGLIPLALAVPLAWIYFAMGPCQEAESPAMMSACALLRFSPLIPAALGVAVLVWLVWDLAVLGRSVLEHKRTRWEHAAHGYRHLDRHHKRHFHFAAAQVVLVSVALAGWLAYEWLRSTR